MKKISLTIAIVFLAISVSQAQWTQSGSILSTTNSVGIGTTSPNALLDVRGFLSLAGNSANIDNTHGLYPLSFLANSGLMVVGWNRTAGSGETDFISNQGAGAPGGFAFYNHDNSNNETQLMWLLSNGNLLIGKISQANSAYKLDVNGSARANAVVVNTTGADFVFDPAYTLITLADVKKYIGANHHLPGMPSAKAMQANGLNLGDNQTKLLQKVEELTLYLIDKDSQSKKQQQQINDQQAQLQLYKQQLAEQETALKKLEAAVKSLKTAGKNNK